MNSYGTSQDINTAYKCTVENHAQSIETFPPSLVLSPISRWPTRLPEATIQTVLAHPIPNSHGRYDAAFRRASIIIVTFNNLVFTKLCLHSVLANTDYPNYEVIVVDNGSDDGTKSYLREVIARNPQVHVVFNPDNRGFAPANNGGMEIAAGELLVLLNNDTIVPEGWLGRLVRHLEDSAIGLVGPVTNRTGNEAQVEVPYRTFGEFTQFARFYPEAHEGKLFDIRMLTMFCVAMRRGVYKSIGSLDERFKVGMFEDDDYALRVRAAGYRVVCAEDVFVHHFGQASIGNLACTGEYGKLFHENRRRWEEKWGIPWESPRHRPSKQYRQLTQRIREVVRATVPPRATVIVVSKGDDELLNLDDRQAWHFPQREDGVPAGYYPADSADASNHLEALRAKGGEFLLFPSTAFWWLDHYVEFKQHLERQYRVLTRQEDTCLIFELREPKRDQGK